MEVQKIIEAPYIILKRRTQNGIEQTKAIPQVLVAERNTENSYTKYGVSCNKQAIGYVSLIDRENGVWVDFIKNYSPQRFSGFGKIADQIEVEHCLNRGLKNFEILSDATPLSIPFHYKRGKRFDYIKDSRDKIYLKQKFGTYNVNEIMEHLLKGNNFPETLDLLKVPMYMPKDLIKKYIDIIAKFPLLKRN